MWTTENRRRYNRDGLRYPSDLTDEEWALVEPLIPSAKRGGRRRTVVVREVLNGAMYVLSTGCQWRYLPRDLPPKSTVHDYLTRWNYDGTSLGCLLRDTTMGRGRCSTHGSPRPKQNRQPALRA